MLLYFAGFGNSPIAILKNLNKLNDTLAGSSSASFSSRIIAIGAYQKQVDQNVTLPGIYPLIKQLLNRYTNQTFSEINIMKAFMRVVNGYFSAEGLQQITADNF